MISVLMSVYASEKPEYLDQALNSIFIQTMQADDFVLVKDGPISEELDHVIEKYISILPINLIQLEYNVGLGSSLRFGLEACKHNLVIRCDSDDINHPDKFRKLYNFAKISEKDVAVIGSSVSEFIGQNNIVSTRIFQSTITKFEKSYRDPVAHPSVLLKKDLINSVGGYKGCLYFEDTYLWLRLLYSNFKFKNLPDVLTLMRVDDGFHSRRCGYRYAYYELSAFWRFYNEGLINLSGMGIGLIRSSIRLLPANIIKRIYFTWLRDE